MASLTTQDGKLVLREGALGTGEECCCETPSTGACCECALVSIEVYGSVPFLTEEDAQEWVDWENGVKAPAMVALAEENGWECVTATDAYISSRPPDNEYYIAEGAWIDGRCCGTVNETFVPLDLENHPANPSVQHGVYVCDTSEGETRTCTDGLTAEECAERCGIHHPGESCADEPCEEEEGACEGTCSWTNDPDFNGPPIGGWYLVTSTCDEETCGCEDPSEACGEAPEYDFEDPEGTVADCTSACNPLP